ncbi:ribosomal protein S13/S18 [Rhizoctonia solani]|nr:ribosomal protein S13/S18 [Rhizoctonia solani]QRW27386.1 ribosomal protein S13/S18 [Rhizoctonia solani]
MVYLLGTHLADHKALKIALTSFYGIGRQTSLRLMARLQIHEHAKVGSLTPPQITQLTAFLSSPSTAPPPMMTPLASPNFTPPAATPPIKYRTVEEGSGRTDRLANIKLESELLREIRENIAHHRAVGTYKGRRHAMGLPVRGQNTRTNAQTARKLNRIERRR